MSAESEWSETHDVSGLMVNGGAGTLRLALLFGAAAVAAAIVIAPFAESRITVAQNADFAGLDRLATGSVDRGSSYTVRRSVLQPNPNSVCIIRSNGAKSGEC